MAANIKPIKLKVPDDLKIPPHTVRTIEMYLQTGEANPFLYAVVCNDLLKAVSYADSKNRGAIADVVTYFNSYVPTTAWGSKEKADAYQGDDAERARLVEFMVGDGRATYAE